MELAGESGSTQLLARRAAEVQQGGARAAVLGVNDGLVSVLCIILAIAGAGSDASAVRLAGLAGLVAGAVSSFFLFTIGGLVPILPWVFVHGGPAAAASVVGTGVAGLIVGGVVARSSGRPIPYGAVRQLLIVLLASAVTYGADLVTSGL